VQTSDKTLVLNEMVLLLVDLLGLLYNAHAQQFRELWN